MPGRRQPIELTPANHAGRSDHTYWVGVCRSRRAAECWCWTEARELAEYVEREFGERVRVFDAKPHNYRVIEFDWRTGTMGDLVGAKT